MLIGDGADREKLESDVARRGIENVVMLGLQPRDAMPDWIASIDLLLVLLRDLPVFETVIPSKIFEFLAQERPVVLAAKGEIRRLMDEAEGALVIDPEHVDQMVAAIENVMQDPETAATRAASGRRWVEDGFIRDDLARRMARLPRASGRNPSVTLSRPADAARDPDVRAPARRRSPESSGAASCS